MYLPEGVSRGQREDAFDLRGSLLRAFDVCRTFKVAFAATVLLTLGLVQAYLMLWPPIYTAEVVVYADSPKDLQRSQFYENWNVFRREELGTEAQLMTGRTVVTRVVKELDLKYEDVFHPFTSHATYLWGESWVGKRYRSVKYFFLPKKKGPYDPTPEEIELGRTVRDLKEGVTLKPVAEANVGHLSVRGPSPRVAHIANKLIDTYLDERNKRFVEEAQRAHDALATEVAKAADELLVTDVARREFLEKSGLAFDFDQEKYEVTLTTELDLKVREAEAELAAVRRKHEELRAQIGAEPMELEASRVTDLNSLRERMKTTRFDLQVQLQALSQRYRPESPEVMELAGRIKQLDDQIAAQPERLVTSSSTSLNRAREELRQRELEIGSELPRLQAGILARRQALGSLRNKQSLIPGRFARGIELMRDLRLREVRFNALSERLAMARVSLATVRSAPSSMRVADYASPPADPDWPKPKIFYPAALAVGTVAGIAVALLLDLLHGRVTRTRLMQTRAGLPVYGTLELAGQTPARALLASALTLERTTGAVEHDRREDS